MPKTQNQNIIEQIAAADTATYEVVDSALVVTQADGRRHEVSLRMSMRKMLSIARDFKQFEALTIDSTFEALDSLESLLPPVLLDAEDLDFPEALAAFMHWGEALGERVGKALI